MLEAKKSCCKRLFQRSRTNKSDTEVTKMNKHGLQSVSKRLSLRRIRLHLKKSKTSAIFVISKLQGDDHVLNKRDQNSNLEIIRNVVSQGLTRIIAETERTLVNGDSTFLNSNTSLLNRNLLDSAITIKSLVGQIDVMIHSSGILEALPLILQPGEVIQSISLGAGNSNRPFDLETTCRVAEFKFINWRGHDPIRENTLFVDFFNLVESQSNKPAFLYVTGSYFPNKFFNGKRKIEKVLEKHPTQLKEFENLYGKSNHTTVSQYFALKKHLVRIIDLRTIVPGLSDTFLEGVNIKIDGNHFNDAKQHLNNIQLKHTVLKLPDGTQLIEVPLDGKMQLNKLIGDSQNTIKGQPRNVKGFIQWLYETCHDGSVLNDPIARFSFRSGSSADFLNSDVQQIRALVQDDWMRNNAEEDSK